MTVIREEVLLVFDALTDSLSQKTKKKLGLELSHTQSSPRELEPTK